MPSMATANPRFQSQSMPSTSLQSFVFPSKASPGPVRRPSSSSSVPSKTAIPAAVPSPTLSENGSSPATSPSAFAFPMKQLPATPRTTSSLGNSLVAGNTQLRTPPLSPSPPNVTLGERRNHARRQSDLTPGKPLFLGTLNQSFPSASSLTTPSPSKSGTSSPNKEGASPRFSSHNGLLSPPLETSTPNPQPTIEKGTPAPAPPGMQARRGHAHRRSSAMSMSSNDVLNIMLTAAKANKPGSVPTSPTLNPGSSSKDKDPVFVIENVTVPETDNKMILEVPSCAVSCDSSASSIINLSDESDESTRPSAEETPRKSRVTFSDATEIIPRPASAGTCSTLTTIRGGMGDSASSLHAYRNSIGSIEELQHTDSKTRGASGASGLNWPSRPKTNRRPSSADAATLLSGAHKTSWLFPPLSPKDSLAKTKKGHSKHLSESSATGKPKRKGSRKVSNPNDIPVPKKVKGSMKGWAGSILLRRHYKKRQLKHLPRRTPTPPMMQRDEIQRLMLEGSYVLMPTSVDDYQPRESSSMEETEFEPQIDLGIYEADMVESYNFPVIDLDAALGPFNTPKSPSKQLSGFDAARKRMHSAAGWNCYHRRAESMPEMQLFSLAEDEIEGDGMGDVFEDTEDDEDDEDDDEEDEEEEEEEGDITLSQDDFPKPVPTGLALNWDTDDSEIEELDIVDGLSNVRKGIKRKMSRLSEDTDPASDSQQSDDGMKMDDVPTSVEILSVPTQITDGQQFSPALSSSTHLNKPMSNASGNVSYGSLHHASSFDQTPAVTPSTTNTSICPPTMPSTPQTSDFLLPPMPHMFQYEDDRLTIMSGASVYEDPALLGEPGPEIRMSVSVDDIPGTVHSHQRFYPYLSASNSYTTVPGVDTASSVAGSEKTKEKKDKRWSKMFSFWKARSPTS